MPGQKNLGKEVAVKSIDYSLISLTKLRTENV